MCKGDLLSFCNASSEQCDRRNHLLLFQRYLSERQDKGAVLAGGRSGWMHPGIANILVSGCKQWAKYGVFETAGFYCIMKSCSSRVLGEKHV